MRKKFWEKPELALMLALASDGSRAMPIQIMDASSWSFFLRAGVRRLVQKPRKLRAGCIVICTITTSLWPGQCLRWRFARPALLIETPADQSKAPRVEGL